MEGSKYQGPEARQGHLRGKFCEVASLQGVFDVK